jgi:hypothetical protein
MVELVFGFWDMSDTLDLLDDLDTFLTKARVIQHTARGAGAGAGVGCGEPGTPVHDELSVGMENEFGAVMSIRFLTDGDDLVAVSIPPHECPTVPFDAIAAWTEPLLRGLCITTTQAAIISALGTPEEQDALHHLVHACDPEHINTPALYTVTTHDKDELRWHTDADADADAGTRHPSSQFPEASSHVTLAPSVHA